MTRPLFPAVVGAALGLAGCVDTTASIDHGGSLTGGSVARPVAPDSSAATWQMPWQLSPSNQASTARGEEVVLAWVPNTGYVRGTPEVLRSLGSPLRAVPGPNQTVEPCRDVVMSEASKIGAKDVEATSGGPQRRGPKGEYFAPVHMRVTYALLGAYEVRETTMTCITSRQGKILDAF